MTQIIRNIAYKAAQRTYSRPGMTGTRAIRWISRRLEWRAYCRMHAGKCVPRRRWWHRSAYCIGMRCIQCAHGRKLGDWLVHLVPYNVRFDLA